MQLISLTVIIVFFFTKLILLKYIFKTTCSNDNACLKTIIMIIKMIMSIGDYSFLNKNYVEWVVI